MSLRKAVLQRITPLPSRTPSPSLHHDWPQSPDSETIFPDLAPHREPEPDEHTASSSKSPCVPSPLSSSSSPPSSSSSSAAAAVPADDHSPCSSSRGKAQDKGKEKGKHTHMGNRRVLTSRSSRARDFMSPSGVVKRWRVNIADHAASLPSDLATVSLSGTVKRDPDLWFDDGNIVLLCRDTAFRVYRGLLTRHSVIFRDLFSMAQPSTSETMESCPVVHISDPPDDLRHLLRVMCGLRSFPIVPGERMEFSELASLVRMSHKYHVDDLHSRAMHHLKLYFTNDLAVWDSAGIDGNLFLHITPPDAITAVNLARLTHTDSVLPTALYLCCQLDAELTAGVERPDGSTERLDPKDLELVLRGRTELVRASTRGACTICRPAPSAQCTGTGKGGGGSSSGGSGSTSGCERALREILNMMLDGLQKDPIGDIAGYAALDSWEHWIEDVVELWPLCEPCRAMLHARDLDVRRDVWKRLPQYMGVAVEDWKDPTVAATPHK
ncbi:hypothetical protein BD414DRAFT_533807 [Trametes punicea]|nr:hypothetical protein BD414DRAFT_533807 [Trametes punicea]